LEEIDRAYVAGLIDGEGCIHIEKKLGKDKTPQYFTLRVSVTNTEFKMVNWLKENFGGHIQFHKKYKENWRRKYQWSIVARQALVFLELIRPYVLVKGEQLELAILFQKRKKFGRWKKPLDRELDRLIYWEMRRLKNYAGKFDSEQG